MKAAVITLHSVSNYGTQLQAYATQEKLKEYFDEVAFIDYRRPDSYGRGLLGTFAKGNPFKALAVLPTLAYWRRLFGGFQREHLNLTAETYLSEKDFAGFRDCADAYFVGSDQVWNTGWNKGVIAPFYLSFAPEGKPRYAYAASFGKESFSEAEVAASKPYIDRFRKISVREESGVGVLRERYGHEGAVRILDPTLAMEPSFWRALAPEPKIKGEYILIYNLKRSRAFDAYAKELSKWTGLPLYRLCTRLDQILKNGKSIVMPEVFAFVTLIDHARLVLTDSFHATAFSMNLGTEPVCIYPDAYSGRISEFLRLVEAEDRHARHGGDFGMLDRPVDFLRVGEILRTERERTDAFLREIVEDMGYERKRGND